MEEPVFYWRAGTPLAEVRFDGQVWSTSTSAGTDVVLGFYDNAALETFSTLERAGSDPTDPFQSVVFATAHENIHVDGVFSVRNGSAEHEQYASGILRVFERG